MQVQLDRLSNGLSVLTGKLSDQKFLWWNLAPYIIGAALLRGFSERALIQPAETVAWATSQVLNGLSWAVTVTGGCKTALALSYRFGILESKDIKKIEIDEEQFEAMKAEIARLQQNEFHLSDLDGMDAVNSVEDMQLFHALYHVRSCEVEVPTQLRTNILMRDKQNVKRSELQTLSDSDFRGYAEGKISPLLGEVLGGSSIALLRQVAKLYPQAGEEGRKVIVKSLDQHLFKQIVGQDGYNEEDRLILADFILREIPQIETQAAQE